MSNKTKEHLLIQTSEKIWNQLHSKLNGEFSYAPLIPKELMLEITEGGWEVKIAKIVRQNKLKNSVYFISGRVSSLTGNSKALLSFSRKTTTDFEFLLKTEDIFFGLKKKFLNAKEVQFGNPNFDSRFSFSTNDDNKLLSVFSNPQIQQEMLNQRHFVLNLENGNLCFATEYPIHNIDFLKHLYNWVSRVFINICLIDN